MTENKRYININSNENNFYANVAKQLGAKKCKNHNRYYFTTTNNDIEDLFNIHGELKKFYLKIRNNEDKMIDMFKSKDKKRDYIFIYDIEIYEKLMRIMYSKYNHIDDNVIYSIKHLEKVFNDRDKINRNFDLIIQNKHLSPKLYKTITITIKFILSKYLKYVKEHKYLCRQDRYWYYDEMIDKITSVMKTKKMLLKDIQTEYLKRQLNKIHKELIEKVWHPKRFNFWKNYDDMFIELEEQ
jgi:hypothetical protein